MANEDLKTALQGRGIDFAGNASRAVLQGLLDKAIKDEEQEAALAALALERNLGKVITDEELAAKAAGADPEKKGPELGKSAGSGDGSPPGAGPAETPDTVAAAAKQEAADKDNIVSVRVIAQSLGEDHGRYEKGETFQTSLERAIALAAFVEVI